MNGSVWSLSRDEQGCWQVQQAFDDASSDQELVALTSELTGHVWEALRCPHANYVLAKCISTIRPLQAQFVIDELREHPGGVAQAARHHFGCRIILRLLEHCLADQVAPMAEDLLADARALASHKHGNYVMQHLLEFGSREVVSRFTLILDQYVPIMAAAGHVGAVFKKALIQPNTESRQCLVSALLRQPGQLSIMSCCRWGHPAVQEALKLAELSERSRACAELAHCADKLRSNRYGKSVLSLVVQLQRAADALAN